MGVREPFVGVDLGGTTIAAGVVQGTQILGYQIASTENQRSAEQILHTLTQLIEKVSHGYRIAGIGMGVPVPAGPETDRLDLNLAENLPTMQDYPLRSRLAEHFKLPVVLENDARCMAYGEYLAGALRECSPAVCLTLGTGLGCGIIIDGRVYRGSRSFAGEIWNIPWADNRILEQAVSIKAIEEDYRQYAGHKLPPHEIFERFRAGDKAAKTVFERFGTAVGRVAVMVLSFLDPRRIAIGGGLAGAFEAFAPSMLAVVQTTWGAAAGERMVRAQLSDRAAVMGAAAMIHDHLASRSDGANI